MPEPIILKDTSYAPEQLKGIEQEVKTDPQWIVLKNTKGEIIYSDPNAKTTKEALQNALDKGVNLMFVDLRGQNLKGGDFKDANLTGADLSYAQLDGTNFDYAHLPYASFNEADLKGASFKDAVLHHADFSNAKCHGATFDNADMLNCQFTDADLKGASLSYTLLNEDIREAKNIPVEVQEQLSKQQVAQQEEPQMDKEQEQQEIQATPEELEDRNEELIKSRSAMDSMIMQSSTRPSEAQIEVSKQADIDVDATYAQVDGGTVPSEVLIQAKNIKGFETLKPSHQIILKTAIKIANKTLASVDANLRGDIKRNFETNYEKAISNGTLNIPPEIQQHVEKKMEQERPKAPEQQQVKERDYKVLEKEMVM